MKRVLIGMIPGFLILLALPYIFITSTIRKSTSATVRTTQKAIQNYLLDEHKWVNWWPADSAAEQSETVGVNGATTGPDGITSFHYHGNSYRIFQQLLSGIEIISGHGADSTKSLLSIIPIGKDSVKLTWEYEQQASINPFTRIAQNRKATRLKKDMGFIIRQLASFLSDGQNIYGIKVYHTTVTDTLLVTTKSIFNHEPNVADIYRLIDLLQEYIAQTGATATNPPMLNMQWIDSTRVEVMVAIPVNKVLDNAGPIAFKRMVPGNILYTEVQGGPATIKRTFRELENYLSDHRYESPAIPFESLVTNRLQQPDTTKWVTRIYYPVF